MPMRLMLIRNKMKKPTSRKLGAAKRLRMSPQQEEAFYGEEAEFGEDWSDAGASGDDDVYQAYASMDLRAVRPTRMPGRS